MRTRAVMDVLESEVRNYPGVEMELANGGKHDRAIFRFGERSRFMAIPKTPSDHRARKNIVRDLKKTMGELGAERVARRALKGRRTRTADAAFAVNATKMVLLIPAHSKLLRHFKKYNRATGHWALEFRATPDLDAPPLLVARKRELPPGKQLTHGLTKGFAHKDGGWVVHFSRDQFPLLKSVDRVPSVDVKLVEETADTLIFKLPLNTLSARSPQVPEHDTSPIVEHGAAEREPEAAPPVTTAEPKAVLQDKPILLQFPKQTVSIEQAIALLNKRKLQLGNKLRFTIKEDGFLTAIHRID